MENRHVMLSSPINLANLPTKIKNAIVALNIADDVELSLSLINKRNALQFPALALFEEFLKATFKPAHS